MFCAFSRSAVQVSSCQLQFCRSKSSNSDPDDVVVVGITVVSGSSVVTDTDVVSSGNVDDVDAGLVWEVVEGVSVVSGSGAAVESIVVLSYIDVVVEVDWATWSSG